MSLINRLSKKKQQKFSSFLVLFHYLKFSDSLTHFFEHTKKTKMNSETTSSPTFVVGPLHEFETPSTLLTKTRGAVKLHAPTAFVRVCVQRLMIHPVGEIRCKNTRPFLCSLLQEMLCPSAIAHHFPCWGCLTF